MINKTAMVEGLSTTQPSRPTASRCMEVTVLSTKVSYSYTIPSFSAITLRLKHARIRSDDNTENVFFDVFFNQEPDCPDFNMILPKHQCLFSGCKYTDSL